jgi:hypothetical protein
MRIQRNQTTNFTHSQDSSNEPSEPFGHPSPPRRQPPVPTDSQQQPQQLQRIASERLGNMVQSNAAAGQSMLSALPPHLRKPIIRRLDLMELPHLLDAIESIPAAQMTTPPGIGYLLPPEYDPFPPWQEAISPSITYPIGNGHTIEGIYLRAGSIRGPNGFQLVLGPKREVYQVSGGRIIPLNANTPDLNRVQMLDALKLAKNAVRRGLGPPLGIPMPLP